MEDNCDEKQQSLESVILDFIRNRGEPKILDEQKKLEKADTPGKTEKILEKIDELEEKYTPKNWLADAARRAPQIFLATHVPKYTHPSSKASSVYFIPKNIKRATVGTHSVKERQDDFFIPDSKELPVSRFLKSKCGEQTILEIAVADPDRLASALSDDIELAQKWIKDFTSVYDKHTPLSHTLMKQLYFPLEDEGEYHLVSPIFPTSLVQEVYERIRESRYSESVKESRNAKRKNEPADGYSEYWNTAVTAYGGTKPQNISQHNSSRYGENILLSSCPPGHSGTRISSGIKGALHADFIKKRYFRIQVADKSIFTNVFSARYYVKELLLKLSKLFATDYDNADIRKGILRTVDSLAGELYVVYLEMKGLEAGWSKDSKCKLSDHQKLWLDTDLENDEYESGEWCSLVAGDFARWLNGRIEKMENVKYNPADAEFIEWRKMAEFVLDDIRRENCNG